MTKEFCMRTKYYAMVLVFLILNFYMENKSFAQSSKETWEKFEFKGFKGKVENILFSKDGSLVYGLGANQSFFYGGEKSLKAWNVSDGKEKFVIKNINSYVLSRDNKMMITWGGAEIDDRPSDNNVIIWDAIEGKELFNLGKHRISNIEFSSNCKKVIGNTIGGDYFSRVAKFKIWDLTKDGEEIKSLKGTGIFDGAGKNIIFFDNETDSINILDSITFETIPAPKRIHSGKELLLTKSFDGKKVASVSVEKNNQSLLKIWDFSNNKDLVDEEKELFEFEENHRVSSVVFSPDGKKLLTKCYQKEAGKSAIETPLSIWNVETGKKIFSLLDDNNNQNQSTTIAFSIGDKIGIGRECIDDNNSDIRYVNKQATMKIIDLGINKEIKIFTYKTNDSVIRSNKSSVPIVFSPNGKIIASAYRIVHNGKIKENENPIELWDTENGEKIFSFDGHGRVLPVGLDGSRRIVPQDENTAVSALAFNQDGTILASGSRDGSIKLWEISKTKKDKSDVKKTSNFHSPKKLEKTFDTLEIKKNYEKLTAAYFKGLKNEFNKEIEILAKTNIQKWKSAAENNVVEAMVLYGICLYSEISIDKNPKEAFQWFDKAAKKDNAIALEKLGECFVYGRGVEENKQLGIDFFTKAAEGDNPSAMNKLVNIYSKGQNGIDKNENKSFFWAKKSANLENAIGLSHLGHCYLIGIGTSKNNSKAFQSYKKSSDLGCSNGTNGLGLCYRQGIGVSRDDNKAFHLYLKAAEAGNSGGMNNLGVCFQNGFGVQKNNQAAVHWYRKAADLGYEPAKKHLQEMGFSQ